MICPRLRLMNLLLNLLLFHLGLYLIPARIEVVRITAMRILAELSLGADLLLAPVIKSI